MGRTGYLRVVRLEQEQGASNVMRDPRFFLSSRLSFSSPPSHHSHAHSLITGPYSTVLCPFPPSRFSPLPQSSPLFPPVPAAPPSTSSSSLSSSSPPTAAAAPPTPSDAPTTRPSPSPARDHALPALPHLYQTSPLLPPLPALPASARHVAPHPRHPACTHWPLAAPPGVALRSAAYPRSHPESHPHHFRKRK